MGRYGRRKEGPFGKVGYCAKPTLQGSLGAGALKEKNEALMAKWLWQFPLEPRSLWNNITKSKYGTSSNGWDAKSGTIGSSCNPWKDISYGYQTFHECCSLVVGNGKRVRFWEDSWVNEGVLKNLFPRLFAVSTKQLLSISHFVDNNSVPVNWDFGFRRNLNDRELDEAISLLGILGHVRLSRARSDGRRWLLDESGVFSCKSYSSYLHSNGLVDTFPPHPLIWKTSSPPKVKVFLWLVTLGKPIRVT